MGTTYNSLKSCWLAVILVCLTFTGKAQQTVDLEALNAYIENAVQQFDVPGFAVGIVKDGELVFSKGYGVAVAGGADSITPHSVFGIASLTKAFTAAALAQQVEQGRLNWDDKVSKILPDFRMNDSYVTRNITVRDLLCHRSGLATFDGDLLWYQTSYSRAEVVKRIRYLEPKQEFRSEFGYQNVMYIAAGMVLEKVSGETWDDYIGAHFFDALDMDQSCTSIKELEPQWKVAQPHIDGQRVALGNYDNSGPAASINSNVDDMSQWMLCWLNGGKHKGEKVLDAKSIESLLAAQTPRKISSFDKLNGIHFKNYALGWNTFDYSGKKVVAHDGGLPGYISKICMVPGEDLGMIILANDMTWLNDALMYKILDCYFNDKTRDWAAEYLEYKKSYDKSKVEQEAILVGERKKGTKPRIKYLDEYEGKYNDQYYGEATVVEVKGKLVLTLEPTKAVFTGTLEHWHDDTFRIAFNDPFLPKGFVHFDYTEAGKVAGFSIELNNPDLHFSNLYFEKR